MHYGVTFSFCSAKVCSPVYEKDTWIAANDYYMYVYIILLFPLISFHPGNRFYSVIIFITSIYALLGLLRHLIL